MRIILHDANMVCVKRNEKYQNKLHGNHLNVET